MITPEIYKKVTKYAKKYSKRVNDIEDIVQESFELFLRNPVTGTLPNKFYYTLVKRGSFHFYFKHLQKSNQNVLKNQDRPMDVQKFDKMEATTPNPEEFYMVKELSNALHNIPLREGHYQTKGLTISENALLMRILNGDKLEYADRGHLNTLKKKLKEFFE